MIPALPQYCAQLRDCSCCGANAGLYCAEPFDHGGIHAFVCRRCGKDPRCA